MARSQRSRQKIEPLDYLEALNAPALRGMTSFLNITPEEAKAYQEQGAQPQYPQVGQLHQFPASDKVTVEATMQGTGSGIDTVPGPVSSPGHKSKGEAPTVTKSYVAPGTVSSPGAPTVEVAIRKPARQHIAEQLGKSDFGRSVISSAIELSFGYAASPEPRTTPEIVKAPEPEEDLGRALLPGNVSSPGYTENVSSSAALTPGRGRSQVRRCVLAQDGHSLGEEAIYQILWRTGRPESTDPNASRVIRMGSAELAQRVNMAKKNVRTNISRLFEKLSLEILEDFGTVTSKPRLYRVFSFRQILERRRAAGLHYVLRNKGVVFCTAEGREIVLSPAYVTAPGDETPRPAPPRERRSVRLQRRLENENRREDVAIVSRVLNRYWPADESAALQLIARCREIRSDATADEIAFFASDKIELAAQDPKIANPTGLVISSVPRCFEGSTFESFRAKREARRKPVADSSDPEATLTSLLLQLHPNDPKRQELKIRLDQLNAAGR